jgi:hypothetical protein
MLDPAQTNSKNAYAVLSIESCDCCIYDLGGETRHFSQHSDITSTAYLFPDTGQYLGMSDRRMDADNGRSKRQKVESDPASNPYLAHMNFDNGDQSYGQSYGNGGGAVDGLKHLTRHATTPEQASKAEDGPNNPFNGKPLSDKYFRILKTRRNLPVHAQRLVALISLASRVERSC